MFRNVAELVGFAENKGEKIFDMIQQGMKCIVISKEMLIRRMDQNLTVMKQALERGLDGVRSHSGLTILCDEVMIKTGQTMLIVLRETVQVGLAATPTGKELNEKYLRLQRIEYE